MLKGFACRSSPSVRADDRRLFGNLVILRALRHFLLGLFGSRISKDDVPLRVNNILNVPSLEMEYGTKQQSR